MSEHTGLDETKKWMEAHNFKTLGFLRDRGGYRFALVSSFDGKTYVTCNWFSFKDHRVGLDCEIVDREPFVVNQMKEIARNKHLPTDEYVYLIFIRSSKNLYDADRIYDLKDRGYPTEEGNDISRNHPYMERRELYEVPVGEAELVNFFNNKTVNEGENFWKEMFHRYIKNAIKWVGNEYTGRYLKDTYGWGVDFIVLGQTNKCIEVGYHTPDKLASRMDEAKKHHVNAYFINHQLNHYEGKKENVGRELKKMATSLDLQLTDRYYDDFSMAYPIGTYEEDE